jgi:hypothetical protein
MTLEEHVDDPDFPYWVVWDIVDVTSDIRYTQLLAIILGKRLAFEMQEWIDEQAMKVSDTTDFSNIKRGIGFETLTEAFQFHMQFAEQAPSLY